jgi:hypothetical protein
MRCQDLTEILGEVGKLPLPLVRDARPRVSEILPSRERLTNGSSPAAQLPNHSVSDAPNSFQYTIAVFICARQELLNGGLSVNVFLGGCGH